MSERLPDEPLSYRQRQARATRNLLLRTARELFVRQGYTTTTMDAIAREAGVSLRTVYATFGSKRVILDEIRETWLAQSGLWALLDQALAEADLGRRLELAAQWTRQQYEQGADLVGIYRGAVTADPEIAQEYRAVVAGRASEIARFVQSLSAGLAPGLNERTAADVFRALTSIDVYHELVLEGGWSPARYQRWLQAILQEQLLAR